MRVLFFRVILCYLLQLPLRSAQRKKAEARVACLGHISNISFSSQSSTGMNLSCTAFMARSTSSISMRTVMRISDVLIMRIFTFTS